MHTKLIKLLEEQEELKKKLLKIDEHRKPIQKRFTYVKNRIATIKYRESIKKVR
jgi:hypothetical protein